MKRPTITGWVVGAAVAVTSVAVAATLTVLVVDSIAAGTATVSSCDGTVAVEVGAPTFANPPGEYVATTVDVVNLDDTMCDGQTVRVTLATPAGASLAEASQIVDAATWQTRQTLTLNTPAPVDEIGRVAAAISAN